MSSTWFVLPNRATTKKLKAATAAAMQHQTTTFFHFKTYKQAASQLETTRRPNKNDAIFLLKKWRERKKKKISCFLKAFGQKLPVKVCCNLDKLSFSVLFFVFVCFLVGGFLHKCPWEEINFFGANFNTKKIWNSAHFRKRWFDWWMDGCLFKSYFLHLSL